MDLYWECSYLTKNVSIEYRRRAANDAPVAVAHESVAVERDDSRVMDDDQPDESNRRAEGEEEAIVVGNGWLALEDDDGGDDDEMDSHDDEEKPKVSIEKLWSAANNARRSDAGEKEKICLMRFQ